jgi:hypothetical protein
VRSIRIGAGALALALVAATVGVLSVLSVVTALPALAHTTQNAGPYALTFGWRDEPCYTGESNAVQLFIHNGTNTGTPVSGITTLTVAVTAGGVTSSPLALNAAFDPDTGLGNMAEYDAPMIPTIVGNYTFHITGTINSTKVDVSATSSDSTFDSAHDPTSIEFPAQPPTAATLATSVTNLQAALKTETAVATKAKSSASSAKTVAIIAIVIAVILGLIAILTGRRKAPGAS